MNDQMGERERSVDGPGRGGASGEVVAVVGVSWTFASVAFDGRRME